MAPILQLDSISKRFGAVVVADGLDLSVPQGQALGVIGPNGAGKTSLFGMITGTLPQDGGRVLFRGADLAGLSPAARCRRGIARSFQVPQPFGGMSVFENLLVAAEFGRADRSGNLGADCAQILERCGLADQANRPAGSLTLLQRKRLELARKLGAEEVFNAKQEGLAMHIRKICGGDGADASFEVVGAAAPLDLAIRSVRKGGQVVLIGNLQPNTPFPLQEVVTRQITIKGSCSCAGEYPEAIRRIQDGSIQVEPLLSAVAPLEEGAGWFKRLYDNKEGLLKVVLQPA
jgi:ABC-type transport system involved in cytochrome c biogenesis ATPase subunit